MQINELAAILAAGLKQAWVTNFAQRGDRAADIEPEYLVTALLARELADHLDAPRAITVALEARTNTVLGTALGFPRTRGQMAAISREGKVDVVLGVPRNGVAQPSVLVEAKRYVAGFSGLAKDVTRLVEFLRVENDNGRSSITAGASAFLWAEERHLTAGQQKKAFEESLTTIGRKAARMAIPFQTRLFYQVLDTSAYNTEADALQPDDEGRPRYESEEPVTIVGGVLIFHRPERGPLPTFVGEALHPVVELNFTEHR